MAYTNFQNCTKQEYEQTLYSQDARHKLKIFFNNVELQNVDRYCEKLTIKSRIIANGSKSFSLNNFISKEVELILHNINTSIIQDQVSISIGTLVGNACEYVPIGIFNIENQPTNDKDKTTIKLRDNSVKFDFYYNAQPLIALNNGSATKLQILQDICTQAGVTCNINSFIGSTDLVGIYDNTITARQYVAYLAEQAGKIATINRNGELIFVDINNLTIWNIPLSIVERYELGEPYKIGQVIYEDGIVIFQTPTSSYDILYLDASNPYISSQTQVTSILGEVDNFEIDSVETGKILGNPAIDSYDIINVYNDKSIGQESIFQTLATNELIYNGVLISTFNNQIGKEERENNVSISGEETFKKWAKTNIDNVKAEVSIQAGQIDTANGRIDTTELNISSQGALLRVISNNSNIDITYDENNEPVSGEVNAVTTKEKRFKLNDNGLTIENSLTNYKSVQDETGTYYYDGNNITGQYTKDGSKQKDLSLFGVYYYGMDEITDTPKFIAQLYTDNDNEVGFGHFWNGGDY